MMKRSDFLFLVLTVLFLPSAGMHALAQDRQFEDETLQYSIRHNLFPGNIGTMTFTSRHTAGSTFHIEAVLHAAVAGIYSLDCTYGSTVRDDGSLSPVAATRKQTEKKYWVDSRYDWSAPGNVHMNIQKSSRAPLDSTVQQAGTIRDMLGILWWCRTLAYEGPVSSQLRENALLLDRQPIPVAVSSYEKKTLRLEGKPVPVIEVVLSHGDKEALRLTLTDDARRLPLLFSISFNFGTIKGTLKEKR